MWTAPLIPPNPWVGIPSGPSRDLPGISVSHAGKSIRRGASEIPVSLPLDCPLGRKGPTHTRRPVSLGAAGLRDSAIRRLKSLPSEGCGVRALREFRPWPIVPGAMSRSFISGIHSPRLSWFSAWWQCGSGARIEFQEALGREDVAFGIFWGWPLRGGVGSTTFGARLGLYERSAFTRTQFGNF